MGTRTRRAAATLLLIGTAAVPATAAHAATPPRAKHTPKVTVTVRTATLDTLLHKRALQVSVRSTGPARVRLTARKQGSPTVLTHTRSLTFHGAKTVKGTVALTAAGVKAFTPCRDVPVVATARVTWRSTVRRSHHKPRTRTHTATRKVTRTLDGDCIPGKPLPTITFPANADRCDPIDAATCLMPFPNDYYTVPDASTATGRRVHLAAASMPVSAQGKAIDPTEYDRNDGFSPNSTIVAAIPGLDGDAAFANSGIVGQTDLARYADPAQAVVLIDATTGARQPIWAEIDKVPTDPAKRALIIHPAVSLTEGQRYVVGLRNLKNAAGKPIPASPVFAAMRDNALPNGVSATIRQRAAELGPVFTTLTHAGIPRSSLNLAWDFTVSSERSISERVLHMRDDAFAQLGDTNLADGTVQGDAPQIVPGSIQTLDYATCAPGARCDGSGQSRYSFRRVTGKLRVPCYMTATSVATGANVGHCASGTRLNDGPDGLPVQAQDGGTPQFYDASFSCIIPRTAADAPTMASGQKLVLYGHGLLGDEHQTEALRLFPAALKAVACGTAWIGMSSGDLPTTPGGALLPILNNLSLFPSLADRGQQGMIDALYLAREMVHPQGFAAQAAFSDGGTHAIDSAHPASLSYLGISQGGIMGGELTALAPDFRRSTLAVPAMGFSTLLTRSTQFNQFLPIVYSAYPDPLQRVVGYSLLQMLWDRAETSGFVHHIVSDPYEDTPVHSVLLEEAFGDHQVTNIQTETEARTLGIPVRSPVLADGRDPGMQTPWRNLPRKSYGDLVGGDGTLQSALFVFDTGPLRWGPNEHAEWSGVVGTNPNPFTNLAPVDALHSATSTFDPATWKDGLDPHEPTATSPMSQASMLRFFNAASEDPSVDNTVDPCGGAPCTAPPAHLPGEGE
jgi:hypothetical protein